jgi:hypothetical protein
MKNNWEPNHQLVQNGWSFFKLVKERVLTPEFIDKQLDRFFDTITIESNYSKNSREKSFEMYVKAFPSIPKYQNPGGGFIQMGCRKPEESINEKYLETLKKNFKQFTGKDLTSVLILPGPYYLLSFVVPGQFERDYTYDKIVWAR